jgi:hypothetical protein
MQDFTVSVYRDALSRQPRSERWSLTGLAARLSTREVVEPEAKVHLPAWSPASYPVDATRRASSVESVSCLVLDVDDGTALDAVWSLWPAAARVLHTSWSHTVEHPKCRLILPLASPVPRSHWSRSWEWAARHARLRGVTIDRACSDASRLYFLPATRSEAWAYEARVELEAPLLDLPWQSLRDPVDALRAARSSRVVVTSQDPREDLRHPDAREALAHRLGATLAGDGLARRADHARCPGCGRDSVYWYMTPRSASGWAACSHVRSCSWRGPLRTLETA